MGFITGFIRFFSDLVNEFKPNPSIRIQRHTLPSQAWRKLYFRRSANVLQVNAADHAISPSNVRWCSQ